MSTEAQRKAQRKYSEKNTVNKGVQFNRNTDADILAFLEQTNESFQALIKRLIRKEISK